MFWDTHKQLSLEASTLGGGGQDTILPKFPKNCMELKEFGGPLLRSTNGDTNSRRRRGVHQYIILQFFCRKLHEKKLDLPLMRVYIVRARK